MAAFLVVAAPAQAGTLAQPTGKVILTVTGNITNTNADGQARFDRAMLKSLGTSTLQTRTHWTKGVRTFEGVSAGKLLKTVGAKGTTLRAIAINDYAVTIPLSDFNDFNVILALKMNGTTLRVRDKGPIWIIYPLDQKPELNTDAFRLRWVWQLKQLNVQ